MRSCAVSTGVAADPVGSTSAAAAAALAVPAAPSSAVPARAEAATILARRLRAFVDIEFLL